MLRIPNEGEEVYAEGLDIKMGSGTPATMVNLSRLGVPVRFCTFLGKDIFSDIVETELKKSGVLYTNLYEGSCIPETVSSTIITENDRTFVSYRDDVPVTNGILDVIYRQCSSANIVAMQ